MSWRCRDTTISSSVLKTNERLPLSDFPTPAYSKARLDNYLIGTFQFSSGCPYRCECCDIPALYGRQPRLKTPEQLTTELDAIIAEKGHPPAIYFVDDNFIGNKKATREMLPHLIAWQKRNDYPLDEMRQQMKATGARIGIAADGDADRFGIVDEDGTFIQPNYVIAVLFDYLVESRGWKNGVAKSVSTTNLINALAEHHGVPLYETPVGFKYIGELIKQDKIAIGGEESAGLSIRYHVPEKDGVLAGLLCCEAVARRKKSIGQQIKDLFGKVGSFYARRENFSLTPEVKAKFTSKMKSDPAELSGRS